MPSSPPIAAVLALAALLAWPSAGRAGPPSFQEQDAIEEFLAPSFVLPQMSVWQFADEKPYLGDQTLVCGKVNFQSLMRQYQGLHRFYATLDHGRVLVAQVEDPGADPSGRLTEKLDLLCGKG